MNQTKEQIHDSLIFPLMAQIIAICKEHHISMIASYDIPTPEEETLCCTTHLPDETGELSPRIQKMRRAAQISRAPSMSMITVTESDGAKTMTAVVG